MNMPIHAAFICAAVILSLPVATAKGAEQASASQDTTAVEKIFSDAFPADAPGAAVLVVRNGSILLRKGFGMASLELGVRIDPTQVFRIGSITKQFTAVGILQLVAAGKMKLDDDISAYVPEFRVGDKVTIAQLLNQTSGLPSYTDEKKWLSTSRQDVAPADLLSFTKGKPLLFQPGTNWAYSNTNYILLGEAIARVSGESYASYVQTKLFGPAGMQHTQYDNLDDVILGRVPGYAGAGPKRWKNATYLSMTQPYAAGALVSTVDDLWKWDKALSEGNLISRRLLAEAHADTLLPDGRSTGYGYGWRIGTVGRFRTIEHGGDINGFTAYEMKVPDGDLYIAILSNNEIASPLVGTGALAFRVARAILATDAETKSIEIQPDHLRDFVGAYRVQDGGKREITLSEGKLFIQRTGGPKSPSLTAISESEFTLSDFGIRFRFTRGPDGRVNALIVKPRTGLDEVCPKTGEPSEQTPPH
jgi:CubicO group peptidase (beta-lactamase class C family)